MIGSEDSAENHLPYKGMNTMFRSLKGIMNTMIFVIEKPRRPEYLAVCQCGTKHGPYLKVALIPPCCPGCEQKAPAKERQGSA